MELLSRKQNNLEQKDYFRKIVNTNEFQRLKNISFLGAIDYSFDENPLGHEYRSRYSHCIDVSRLALMVSEYKKYSADIEKHLVIAALLHDIGHMPLSHSIERDVKNYYGVDHHKIGCSILKGESPLGKKLFTILKKYVDVDEVINLINCESSFPGHEIFSNAINVDTIDGITRAANYANLNDKKLVPEEICLNAFNLVDDRSQTYVDDFWFLKGQIYSKLILNRKGLLADHASGSYFRNNAKRFAEKDLFEDEVMWEKKHPKLFSTLRCQKLLEESNVSSIDYFGRSYTVDFSQSGNDRYVCRKRKETLFLQDDDVTSPLAPPFIFIGSKNRSTYMYDIKDLYGCYRNSEAVY
jgi:hypothetical protein